jgi:8-oxo-dGTP pyrophosphatase MutT (NUDIX family)
MTSEMRAWITERLDPLEVRSTAVLTPVDFDANLQPGPGRPPNIPAAVLIGLVERPEGLTVILTRRADHLRKHTGQIAFPGGRMEVGETPWESALREAQEEIGLDPGLVTLAGLSSPFAIGTGFLVTPVVGFVPPDVVLQANPNEVAEIFETPFGFLMDPANHERRFIDLPDGDRRWFYAMTHQAKTSEERVIWGATAGMLRQLYDRLYGGEDA